MNEPPSLKSILLWLSALVAVFALICGSLHRAHARDLDGRFTNSPLKPWFDGLRSGKGPCCSDADGSTVADADWESRNGHYRVRLPWLPSMKDDPKAWVWVDVPDEAVITEPNKAGFTMVWPVYGDHAGPTIRCFMPGPMT